MAVLSEIGFVEDFELDAFGKPPEVTERLLANRDRVFSEEAVRTVHDGHLHLRFNDDTILRLGSSSEMVLDRFAYDPATRASR